jgi:heat shock protein HspQ
MTPTSRRFTGSERLAAAALTAPARLRYEKRCVISASMASREMPRESLAKFAIGQVVKHRRYPFRGVIYDVDPEFANTEEWWLSIPEEVRPRKDQPFYHLFAENSETEYVAYVSEQNLLPDTSGDPVRHPQVDETFERAGDGAYRIRAAKGH